MLLAAFPLTAGLDVADADAATVGAAHAVWPADLNHERMTIGIVGEMLDRFLQCCRGVGFSVHTSILITTDFKSIKKPYNYR